MGRIKNAIKYIKKKIFKEEQVGIINIGDIISIPGREYYKDDDTKLRLIDDYKEKYLEVLSQKKIITTLELDSNNLKKDLVMIVDLILHSVFDINKLSSLTYEELLIKQYKLNLYYEEMDELQTNTLTRLIALKELQKGRQVPRRNRMCLNEEINQLTASLVIFLRQQSAIIIEMKSYVEMININNSAIDLELLKLKYNKLIFISQGIINNDELDKFSNIEEKIAYIEIELEKYSYRSKSEIGLLNSKLEEIINTPKNKDNKNELLNEIIKLEKKYLLFYLYGINLINEEDIKRMYNVKFDILVCDIDYLRKSPIANNDYGFEYYKEIVFKKIETIILGKNVYFNQMFKDKEGYALSTFIHHYKYNGKYDFEFILDSKYMLNLLVCFDKEKGFEEMLLKNTLQNGMREEEKTYFEKYLDIPGIVWDDKVPLVSILQLIYSYCPHPLYELFKISDYKSSLLPEGVKVVNGDLLPKNLLSMIRDESMLKNIVFPNSLKKVIGKLFYYNYNIGIHSVPGNHDEMVILNYGLEYVGDDAFYGVNAKSIVIPSTLSEVGFRAFGNCQFQTIIFDDYKNSNILNDRCRIKDFIKLFFKWSETGNYRKRKFGGLGDYIFTTDINYISSVCCLGDDLEFWEKEVESSSSLEYIILKDGEKKLEIDLKDISKIVRFKNFFNPYGSFISGEALTELGDNLRELILKKTGHDIFGGNQDYVRKKRTQLI